MGYPRNEEFFVKYDYDFAAQGGAVSTISLAADVNGLEENVIVKDVYVIVKTALTSGGSATVTLGNTADPDGYLADIFALAGTDNAVINSGAVAGALIWDDTNDHGIHYRVTSAANTQDLVLDIGTAALTAGKLEIYLRCGYNQV